jgi:hypothetical protein
MPTAPQSSQPANKENTMADTTTEPTANSWIGKYVIVRCRDAGVHAGILTAYSGRCCELTDSRRLWYWKPANNAAFLSGAASQGLDHKASKIGAATNILLTENCEIIACTAKAVQSISEAPNYEPR